MNKLSAIIWGLWYFIMMFVFRPIDVVIVSAIKGFPFAYWDHVTAIAKERWDELGEDGDLLKDYVKELWNNES